MNNLLEKKKPIYKKSWFWIIIVLLFVIGSNARGINISSHKSKITDKIVNKTENIRNKNYEMGDKVVVGDLEFVVMKTTISKKIGGKYLNRTAKGQYLIIDVKVKNKGKKNVYLSSSNFKIINEDMTFEPDASAGLYLEKKAFMFDDLNPESSMKGKIVFDMAGKFVKSIDNKLEVSDGIFDGEALISLK